MATRAGMHRGGAAILGALFSQSGGHAPRTECSCGSQARYDDQRPKRLLTALVPVQFERASHVCPGCLQGHSPQDRQLDVEGTECSPAVRRMMALVGAEGSFEKGREQLALLAGLEVTAKAVERHTETIGADIASSQQREIRRAKQLDLPEALAPPAPVFYIEMDGTGVPVVKAESAGRSGKIEDQPARTWEAKLGCVFTQTATDPEGRPVRDEDSSTYTAAIETAEEFGLRLYTEAWRRDWSRAKKKVVLGDGPSGAGIWPTRTSPARFKSWISSMPASISGSFPPNCSSTTTKAASVGWRGFSTVWIKARSNPGQSLPRTASRPSGSAQDRGQGSRVLCAQCRAHALIRVPGCKGSSWAQESSKLAARL